MYYEIPVWLSGIVKLPGSIKLSKLHQILLAVMGWQDGHLHEFIFADAMYGQAQEEIEPGVEDESRVWTTLRPFEIRQIWITRPCFSGVVAHSTPARLIPPMATQSAPLMASQTAPLGLPKSAPLMLA